MSRRKWSEADIDRLKELARLRDARYIADWFGTSRTNIYRICSLHKIKLRSAARKSKPPKESVTIRRQTSNEDIATRIRILKGEEIRPERPRKFFSDEQLRRFIDSPVAFAKEVLNVEFQLYQRDMCDKMMGSKPCCFAMGRQTGKDFVAAVFSLWECITKPNYILLIVSAAQRQSDLLMERIIKFIASSPELFDSVERSTMSELRFTNNSVIYALPATGLIRGFSEVDRIIANEVRDIPDAAFDALYPMLAVKNGLMVLMSTPLGMRGHFWEAFNNPLFEKMHLPTRFNKYVSEEYLENQKASMSAHSYAVEYEAQFMDVSNAYFNLEPIMKCVKNYDPTMTRDPSKSYSLGVDWGRFRDSSVLTVVSEDSDKNLKVEYIQEFVDTTFKEQLAFIRYLHNKFKFTRIVSEYAGLGIGPTEQLIEEKLPVTKFKPTVDEKLKAYDHLKLKMEAGKLTLPSNYLKLLTPDLLLPQCISITFEFFDFL